MRAPRFADPSFRFLPALRPGEAAELGVGEALDAGLVIAEWPERLGDRLPADRLEIALAEDGEPDRRHVELEGFGSWAGDGWRASPRSSAFSAAPAGARRGTAYLNGDASARGYTRLRENGASALLMDWPKMPAGPPIRRNRPYSQIAHLAEDVRPFVAVAEALRGAGLAAPRIMRAGSEMPGCCSWRISATTPSPASPREGGDLSAPYRLAVDALAGAAPNSPPPRVLHADGVALLRCPISTAKRSASRPSW